MVHVDGNMKNSCGESMWDDSGYGLTITMQSMAEIPKSDTHLYYFLHDNCCFTGTYHRRKQAGS